MIIDENTRVDKASQTGQQRAVEEAITGAVEELGYDLVSVRISGDPLVLLIMAEPKGGEKPMLIDDCAKVSRAISAILDVEDPISGKYSLEVSSPGIDRPLTRLKDFTYYAGYLAKVKTAWPIDGRSKFTGKIIEVEEDGSVIISIEGGDDVAIAHDAISKAQLVLTDELIEASKKKFAK